ncbi:MAG: 3-keto-disaccharide hydrolase [Opitutaceae bacterium]
MPTPFLFRLLLPACIATVFAVDVSAADWTRIFNGKNLEGWKSNDETPGSFVVEDGAIKTANGRAHLFYVGPDGDASFKNFELKARVKHSAKSNSGIYIHTKYQPSGWPDTGYECQVNSSSHKDPRKTGGLYAVKDVMGKAPVEDAEWFDYVIRVEGRRIVIKIDGETTVDWTEPEDWNPATALNNMPGRKLSEGTIALQAHDPDSVVYYKDILIRPLR